MSSLSPGDRAAQASDARAAALRAHVSGLREGAEGDVDGALDAVASGLVDTILAGDVAALRGALPALRAERLAAPDPSAQGAAAAFAATAHWSLERLPDEAEAVPEGTLAWRFLAALRAGPVGSAELRGLLSKDETQVSRTGGRLLDAGLVVRRKAGRQVSWELSPRGRVMLDRGAAAAPPAAGPPRRLASDPGRGRAGADVEWWRDLLRSAWRAPAADTHASGDPVRDRILATALELHVSNGVLETTWELLADRAGVPVEAIDERFPTVEDLVPACGGLAFAQMRLPPPEAAAGLFADRDAGERLRILVATLFDLYDRVASAIEMLRRDSGRLAVLDHSRTAVEESIDAMVAAALDPSRRTPEMVGLVRALTDIPVWRALRRADLDESAVAEALMAALGIAATPGVEARAR